MSISPRTSIVFAFVLASTVSAQTLVRSVNGPAAGAQFGKACITIPDQNGDGYKDLLVGAPGFNQERGALFCLSGAFLASGTGTQMLWSTAPTANQGDRFGSAIASVDDATGDGIDDFLVGQPGYDSTSFTDCGAIRLVSGSSHAVLSLISGIGSGALAGTAIAATGDLNFDGRTEVLVGCPGGPNSQLSRLLVFRNTSLASSGSASTLLFGEVLDTTYAELGSSLAAKLDYVNTGGFVLSRFIAGAPGYDGVEMNAGKVVVGTMFFNGSLNVMASTYFSSTFGERMGSCVDAAHDYDGDGVTDYVVGAPNSPNGSAFEVGRAVVLSGARVLAQTAPYEIYAYTFGSVVPPVNHADPNPNFHFGAVVRACADLNGDGVGEILVGAPDYFTQSFFPSGWNFRGLVRVFSGATGTQFVGITGASTDRLGNGRADVIDDLDGDGFDEFVVAGSISDAGGTDSGVLKCYRLFPIPPASYCVGKVNSLGCTPSIAFGGTASASSATPFAVTATNFINQKSGLLFYSHAPTVTLFQGGTLCVAGPSTRTPAHSSGGSTSGSDCTGAHGLDFNARVQSGVDPALVAGAQIFAQFWSRDPAAPSHTSLSNALRFVINP